MNSIKKPFGVPGMNAFFSWLRSLFSPPAESGSTLEGGFLAQALVKSGFQSSPRYPRPRDRFPRRECR